LAPGVLGSIYLARGNFPMALRYYQIALNVCVQHNNLYLLSRVYREYTRLYWRTRQLDSCMRYANLALAICQKYNFGDYASDVYKVLVEMYKSNNQPDSALKYLQAMVTTRDSLFNQTRASQFLLTSFDEKQRQQEIEIAQTAY